ncbi:MAG: HGxxPAAW family protein, partial [Nocardioidaceae bacterium]
RGARSMSNNHGSTPAAWTGVILVLLAFAVGAVGLILMEWPVFWTGVGLLVLGPIAAKVMAVLSTGTS